MKLFVFIIASFNEPVYIELIKLRKLQLKKLAIPHYFVFDDIPPPEYTTDENDLFFEKVIPVKPALVNPHMNPFMITKFLKALKMINESEYDVILRINISTFVDFEKLRFELGSLQRPYAAAHLIHQTLDNHFNGIYKYNPLTLLSGTCIAMTSEIITFLKTIDLNLDVLSELNDDTVLSHLIQTFTRNVYNIDMQFLENIYLNEDIGKFSLFRIKCQDRYDDIVIWKNILKHFESS